MPPRLNAEFKRGVLSVPGIQAGVKRMSSRMQVPSGNQPGGFDAEFVLMVEDDHDGLCEEQMAGRVFTNHKGCFGLVLEYQKLTAFH